MILVLLEDEQITSRSDAPARAPAQPAARALRRGHLSPVEWRRCSRALRTNRRSHHQRYHLPARRRVAGRRTTATLRRGQLPGSRRTIQMQIEDTVSPACCPELANLQARARHIGRTSFICSSQSRWKPIGCVRAQRTTAAIRSGRRAMNCSSPFALRAALLPASSPRRAARTAARECLGNVEAGIARRRSRRRHRTRLSAARTCSHRKTRRRGTVGRRHGPRIEQSAHRRARLFRDDGRNERRPQIRQQASIIQRESLRMKRIIENLVRFAKQDKANARCYP